MENTTKTVFSMDGVDYTRTVVTDESGKKILDCTENNSLSLEGDITIHATKVDGVLTRTDKAPSEGIVKDLDCYGGFIDWVEKANSSTESTYKLLTRETFTEAMRQLDEAARKPRIYDSYMSVDLLKMTNLDDLFFSEYNWNIITSHEGSIYINDWKKGKLKELEERKAFMLAKYKNPRKSILKELDRKINIVK